MSNITLEAPEISRRFTSAWYDSGEKENTAMIDLIHVNGAEQTTPGIFLNCTILYHEYEDALLAARKAVNTAIGLNDPVASYVVREVPHFSATPEYLIEDDPTIGKIVWINAHVILEQGETAFRRVLDTAKAEAAAWEKAEKGDFGPLHQIQARERYGKRMPSYRTSSLKLDEVSRSIHALLQRKGI